MAHHVIRHWAYTGDLGPSHWPDIVPDAGGKFQSPVVISPSLAVYDPQLHNFPMQVHYSPTAARDMHNHGRSVQFNIHGTDSCITGGPLHESEYQLRQFHFHWGADSSRGSEHKIGDKTYAGELHLVHWNHTQFHTFEDALHPPDGLCVLAVFVEVGKVDHPGMAEVCKLVESAEFAGDEIHFPEGLDPTSLLPNDISCYWTYSGSLTTPPCHESVRFIVLKEPIQVSERQLEVFRSLKSVERGDSECHHLVDNFRPTMPLNGRQVSASFRKFFA
jgi:carbonic anhydrase